MKVMVHAISFHVRQHLTGQIFKHASMTNFLGKTASWGMQVNDNEIIIGTVGLSGRLVSYSKSWNGELPTSLFHS